MYRFWSRIVWEKCLRCYVIMLYVCRTEWRLIRPDGIGVHIIIWNKRRPYHRFRYIPTGYRTQILWESGIGCGTLYLEYSLFKNDKLELQVELFFVWLCSNFFKTLDRKLPLTYRMSVYKNRLWTTEQSACSDKINAYDLRCWDLFCFDKIWVQLNEEVFCINFRLFILK